MYGPEGQFRLDAQYMHKCNEKNIELFINSQLHECICTARKILKAIHSFSTKTITSNFTSLFFTCVNVTEKSFYQFHHECISNVHTIQKSKNITTVQNRPIISRQICFDAHFSIKKQSFCFCLFLQHQPKGWKTNFNNFLFFFHSGFSGLSARLQI